MIHAGTGDLLDAPADALVNPVNCEGVMGKGLALQFKRRWPAMFEAYRIEARAGHIVPGTVHVWPTGSVCPRYLLNFPTKRHWRDPSRLEDIESGLVSLVCRIQELELRGIALPALGAGLGGLDWRLVRPRILAALDPLTHVEVWLWEPGPR